MIFSQELYSYCFEEYTVAGNMPRGNGISPKEYVMTQPLLRQKKPSEAANTACQSSVALFITLKHVYTRD